MCDVSSDKRLVRTDRARTHTRSHIHIHAHTAATQLRSVEGAVRFDHGGMAAAGHIGGDGITLIGHTGDGEEVGEEE